MNLAKFSQVCQHPLKQSHSTSHHYIGIMDVVADRGRLTVHVAQSSVSVLCLVRQVGEIAAGSGKGEQES